MKLPSLKRMYTRDRCPDDYCCFSSSVHSPIEPAELSNFPHANFHWLPTAKQYFPHKNKTDIGFLLWFGKKDHITPYAAACLFFKHKFYFAPKMDGILEKNCFHMQDFEMCTYKDDLILQWNSGCKCIPKMFGVQNERSLKISYILKTPGILKFCFDTKQYQNLR